MDHHGITSASLLIPSVLTASISSAAEVKTSATKPVAIKAGHLLDATVLEHVAFVMKSGVVYKSEIDRTPAR